MNYTTLAFVKAAFGATETTDDALLQQKIAEASRTIDKTLCKAFPNYFELAEVEGELLEGLVDHKGNVIVWPMKSNVVSVESFEFRYSPAESWQSVDPSLCTISNVRKVEAWGQSLSRGKCFVRISYTGGYGTEEEVEPPTDPVSFVITGLPEDIIDAATVLSVRFYKEEKAGLTDAIGVAELGTMQYTKAIPARVIEMMTPYKRRVR